jgi:hypothetical protein
MSMAASQVWGSLINGKLEVRGRLPGQLDFQAIPATHWRSTAIRMIRHNVTLWEMNLFPTGGAEFDAEGNLVRAMDSAAKDRTDQISRYDAFIVRARQFESLWPRKNPVTDKARKKLLKKAKKAGADPAEIQKLDRE